MATLVTIRHFLISVLFMAFLLVPLAVNILDLSEGIRLNEKRLMASMPSLGFSADVLKAFPAKFEIFFNDHFGLRATLVYGHNFIKVFWLGSSPVSDVILGKQGWLFFGNEDELRHYRRNDLPLAPNLQLWVFYFEQINSWLNSRDMKLLLLIAPNKTTIYHEFMPDRFTRAPGPSHLDQLVKAIRPSGLTVIDPRSALWEAKRRQQLFYRHDTHWNDAAGYLTYRKVMDRLIRLFPRLQPQPESGFAIQKKVTARKDLAEMLGLSHFFQETEEGYTALPQVEPNPGKKPANAGKQAYTIRGCYVLGDSFAEALLPFLSPHCDRLTSKNNIRFEKDQMEREGPALVILEILERLLGSRPDLGELSPLLRETQGIDFYPAVDFKKEVGRDLKSDSVTGTERKAVYGKTSRGTLLFGPYTTLKKGEYTAIFRMKIDGDCRLPVVKIDVSAEGGKKILTQRTLSCSDFEGWGKWNEFRLAFAVSSEALTEMEYRAEYLGGAGLNVENIRIIPQGRKDPLGALFNSNP